MSWCVEGGATEMPEAMRSWTVLSEVGLSVGDTQATDAPVGAPMPVQPAEAPVGAPALVPPMLGAEAPAPVQLPEAPTGAPAPALVQPMPDEVAPAPVQLMEAPAGQALAPAQPTGAPEPGRSFTPCIWPLQAPGQPQCLRVGMPGASIVSAEYTMADEADVPAWSTNADSECLGLEEPGQCACGGQASRGACTGGGAHAMAHCACGKL